MKYEDFDFLIDEHEFEVDHDEVVSSTRQIHLIY